MSAHIIHSLEVIDVDEGQPQGHIKAVAEFELGLQVVAAFASIRQPGQRVVGGDFLQTQLQLLVFADVAHHADDACGLGVRPVFADPATVMHPNVVAVTVA